MGKKGLIFNVGSSSIKYCLFENKTKKESGNYEKLHDKKDYKKALNKIFDKFKDEGIDYIAHRVVHGGDITKPEKITKRTEKKIKEFSKFAPLHNPKQLMVIDIVRKKTDVPQYSVFDTMFFSEIPEVAKTYAIPSKLSKKYGIRKYGFHGLSHKYVSKDLNGKTITCHLGSGCSVSAIDNGVPLDTSMGMTPLEGLIMRTRSGSIDPGLILFLRKKGHDIDKILRKDSGLKGISGKDDFRDILETMNKNKKSKLAYDMFIYNLSKIIGSYLTVLNGLDNIVFTAAIGENVPKLRREVCNTLNFMDVKLDDKKNKINSEKISQEKSSVNVYVRKTDEETQIVEEIFNSGLV